MDLTEMLGKDSVLIEGTTETPEINLNAKNGEISFAGRSLPENPKIFYDPIKTWLAGYSENPAETTHVSFVFDYFNTASSKLIMEIIDIIRIVESKNGNLKIDWYYQEDDEDMMEAGEDFESVTGAQFNFISYP